MKCKKCKNIECNLSRRNSIERMVGQILPARPYRCSACHARFWGLDRPLFTIGRAAIAGFGLFSFLWFLVVFFIVDGEPLTAQPVTQAENQASAKENTDKTAVVETEKIANPSMVLQEGQQDSQAVLGKADSPVLDVTQPPPISDFVKALSERNKTSNPDATPETSAAIESQPAPIKAEKQVREKGPSKAVASVESNIPKKKPLPAGRLRLERMSLKPTSGTTLVLYTDRPIENHTFFRLEGPARMVVDLPGKWSLSKQVPLLLTVDADLVKKIRLGQDPENLRIVFDLGSTPVNEPFFESKANSLEITLIAQ